MVQRLDLKQEIKIFFLFYLLLWLSCKKRGIKFIAFILWDLKIFFVLSEVKDCHGNRNSVQWKLTAFWQTGFIFLILTNFLLKITLKWTDIFSYEPWSCFCSLKKMKILMQFKWTILIVQLDHFNRSFALAVVLLDKLDCVTYIYISISLKNVLCA